MKNYEITFITSEDLKETPVKTAIEKFGGKILKTEFSGEKQLAYKIQKLTKGFYTSVIFEMPSEKVADLNKVLTLDEEIIRFLLISAERSDFAAPERKPRETALEKPKTEMEIEPEKELMTVEPPLGTQIAEPPLGMQPVEKKEIKKEEVKPEKKVTPVIKQEKIKEPVKVEKPKKIEEKVEKKDARVEEITSEEATEEERLKALDKKLDELLKE